MTFTEFSSVPCSRAPQLWVLEVEERTVNSLVKSSQVSFIYIALLTIQIVSKHLTASSWRTECQ